jgi:L-threonylcarbamoyladenylate synthase
MWNKVGEILKSGGVAIIPSESSYGMAALASSKDGVEKLYKIKGRSDKKPSLVIVSSVDAAKTLVKFTPLAESLAKKYWPGGLTIVLEALKQDLAPIIYGEGNTLAVRLPGKPELLKLAQNVGSFILPSANFDGQKPPFTKVEIDPNLRELVDFVLDEPTDGNPVSTLVDARGEKPIILRQGAVILVEKS